MPEAHHLIMDMRRSDDEIAAAARLDEEALEWLHSLPINSCNVMRTSSVTPDSIAYRKERISEISNDPA